jgi:lipopolysaccharide biosynthesis protein
MKNSICLFSSYFTTAHVPYYVQYYVLQLRKHFDKFVFITNEKELNNRSVDFFRENQIELDLVKNEGFDFGMWGKAMEKYPVLQFDYVALINDSCILFRPLDSDFDRIQNSTAQVHGMILSDRYATHLQSFFLVLHGPAIALAKSYFQTTGLVAEYREVIQKYEIGLSQHFIQQGFELESLYNKGFSSFPKNPSFARVRELIEEGMPMIKKKIVYRNFRGLEYYWVVRMGFDTDYRKYVRFIEEKYSGEDIINFEKVMQDAPKKGHTDIALFAVARAAVKLAKAIPPLKWLILQCIQLAKKWRQQ